MKNTCIGLEQPHGAGIGRYGANLARHLAQLDSRHEYLMFPGALSPDLTFRNDAPRGSRFFWRQLALPLELSRRRIALFHGLFLAIPLAWQPTVMTIHDMVPLLFPQYAPGTEWLAIRLLYGIYARRATAIVTVSEATKRDVVRLLRVPAEKVEAIPNGVEPCFRRTPRRETTDGGLGEYGIERPFILFVGTLEPRKNVVSLIEAYSRLHRNGTGQYQLVIVGRRGWSCENVFQAAVDRQLGHDVVFRGAVSDAELIRLYNAATVFVYPSFYEGFGLPVLEAMACGTPVITSNTSSLPEIVGDAAMMVDPRETEELASAMSHVLQDAGLREQMSARGLERARLFSWNETARRTLSVYERVLDESGDRRPS